MGIYNGGRCVAPVITKERMNEYKNDEFYVAHLKFILQCKRLSNNDMELKYLTSVAKKTLDLLFFAKHNQCEIYYDREDMLDDVYKGLINYVSARYNKEYSPFTFMKDIKIPYTPEVLG